MTDNVGLTSGWLDVGVGCYLPSRWRPWARRRARRRAQGLVARLAEPSQFRVFRERWDAPAFVGQPGYRGSDFGVTWPLNPHYPNLKEKPAVSDPMAESPTTRLHRRVEHDLTLHPPLRGDYSDRMDGLRAKAKEFAHLIVDACPVGREQSSALTKVEEALFYAIAAVARNQE